MGANLLVLSGPPCSGKSSLAEAIHHRHSFHWLQLDRVLRSLMPDSLHKRSDRDVGYRAIHLCAEELLRGGRPVILDATYSSSEQRSAVESIAAELSISLHLVECQITPDTAAARFKNRSAHLARDMTEDLVRDVATRYCYSGLGLRLEETCQLADSLRQVVSYVRNDAPLRLDGSWPASAVNYVRTA